MDGSLVHSLLEGVPLPTVLIGQDSRIRQTNAAAVALLGPAVTGRHYLNAMRQPELREAIEAALQTGQTGQVRITFTGPAVEATYRVTVSPVAGGGQSGVLAVFEDISEAEKIGQMRRDFVANVSHELRTPLTALMGFIETLRGAARDDPAARARFLGIMEREAGRMNRLVRDLLQLSRVEAEERVRPTERVDLAALAQSAVATHRSAAEDAGVEMTLTGAEQPAMIMADPDQIMQVLHNLIENALKYGGAGGRVEVALDRQAFDAQLRGPALQLTVRDWGEGIDPIHLPRLTERFYRVDNHRSRERGGTGLGLAIVKHIVHRHRGRLRIDSDRGKGATFTILLPAP